MITKISGKLLQLGDDEATIEVSPFEYQVQIPDFARRQLQSEIGNEVSLHTLHYLDGNPAHGRLTPRLVGFVSPVEREFFEMFCSVDGVGMRKALRAMKRPVREVAELIEAQDPKGLATLPGIGAAMAERIIAKLRRKMPKFALIVTTDVAQSRDIEQDLVRETYEILCQLGHSEADAHKLIEQAIGGKKKHKDVDSMLQEIYQQTHS